MHVAQVTFDSLAPLELAEWWASVFGGAVEDHDGFYTVANGGGLELGFQYVAAPTPGKNRLHLDLAVAADLRSEVERLAALGARVIRRQESPGIDWVVLADPEDNQFCVSAGF
jgi:predicted enzyme related to lactoylglutathione lyase